MKETEKKGRFESSASEHNYIIAVTFLLFVIIHKHSMLYVLYIISLAGIL